MSESALPRNGSSISVPRVLFFILALVCLLPIVSSAVALLMGILFSVILRNPYLDLTRKLTQRLLQVSIIGLGAGMNLTVVGKVGVHGVGYTAIGLLLTGLVGMGLGKAFRTKKEISVLLTVGTGICGGSAIAAVASTIRAKSHDISVALATVFFLNASALVIFPPLGHYFGMTESQFGLWSALAIHDTSSVVGAAIQFGAKATEIATTVKLARALWIIPVSIIVGFLWTQKQKKDLPGKIKYPWFILGFLVTAAIVTWIPELQLVGSWVNAFAKRTLVLTLFLIGSALTRETIQSVGFKPFLQGFCLWVLMASATLGAILAGWIS